jgi:hypothetical protein
LILAWSQLLEFLVVIPRLDGTQCDVEVRITKKTMPSYIGLDGSPFGGTYEDLVKLLHNPPSLRMLAQHGSIAQLLSL